ncbi:MAG: ATP-dependent zinc metalloprotease FtsH [Myxococcota bacterium]|nr:ATP-dependent zinc metalloprotease FtsH [Myxococcota bacterium]
MWAVVLLLAYFIYSILNATQVKVTDVGFSSFLDRVETGELKNIEIDIKNETEFLWTQTGAKYRAIGKLTDDVIKRMREKEVNFKLSIDEGGFLWQSLLFSWLPMLIVFLFLFFLMRQLQAGGGKAMSFGKSKARLVSEGAPKITFKDIAGIEEAKEELREIVEFLKDPKKFTRLGGRIPKGVLLVGPPGTGKTLLAKGVAGEAGAPFFSISGSDFVEMFVGVGASRVRDLFEQSKQKAPCIIFIDEIDAVGRHRGAGLGGGHDEREQTLNQLLVEMDGFESNEGVILIAATNRVDVLDPALLRPGRFDRRVTVPNPDMIGRGLILKVHTRKVPLDQSVDLNVLARGTPGFSGADLANMVNEAALIAAKLNKTKVEMADFELAKDKVMMGAERKSMVMSEADLRNTAYHEAGHALVAAKLNNADPVHKVTIIPRGPALGVTHFLPLNDRYGYSKKWALDHIAVAFGGRIAEEVVFDELTTGAGNDFDKASELARKMICNWGMSESLGPVTFSQNQGNIFLGRDFNRPKEYSEQTAITIDQEVKKILTEQYARATAVILEHRACLERIAEALIVYETIDADELQCLIRGEELTREPPKVKMTTREEIEERQRQQEERSKSTDILGPLAGGAEA